MSIAIIIPESWEPSNLVRWSTSIARARNEDLLIIRTGRLVRRHKWKTSNGDVQLPNSPLGTALKQHTDGFEIVERNQQCSEKKGKDKQRTGDKAGQRVYITRLNYADLVDGVLGEVKALRIRLLIVPRARGVKLGEEGFAIERRLFREVPCETLLLRPGAAMADGFSSILVATSGSKHAVPALSFGAEVAASQESKITALFVDEQAQSPTPSDGSKQVNRSIRKSLKKQADLIEQDTIVDDNVPRGVQSYASQKGHDVVVVGAGEHLSEDSRFQDSVPEKLMSEMDEPTVVVVRNAMPLANRVLKSIDEGKKRFFPQLDRDARIDLVERLESCSKWDFDFMFLICLATLIASLGLAVDSPPVVIGAMLVAPLMSPMLGVGLSVVQGNRQMGHRCTLTIGRGVLVALTTAASIGIVRIAFASDLTKEMTNRGAPGVPDLLVAFASGAVAAYAFGRPHLLSVIPGIAIATSLIPPLATAGLGFVAFEFDVALGAALLFTSNFVAIVLGTAASLWVVGMRGPRSISRFSAWTRRWTFGFCTMCFFLAMFFTVQRQLRSQTEVASVAPASSHAAVDSGHDATPLDPSQPVVPAGSPASERTQENGDLPQRELTAARDESQGGRTTPGNADSQTLPGQSGSEDKGQYRVVLKPPPPDNDSDPKAESLESDKQSDSQKAAAANLRDDANRPASKRRPVLRFLRDTIVPPVVRQKD